jgi:hypothetical protein
MEARFGEAFDGVRVHTDVEAARLAAAAGARAYTVGQDIVFGLRQYSPGTPAGLRLLAHELAHVLQQRTAGGPDPGTAQEREAERVAGQAGADARVHVTGTSAPGVPQLAGESAGQPRLIFLDTNVIVDIAIRGNTWIEGKIQELRRQGHEVYLSQQVYNELVLQPKDPGTVAAQRAAIQRLGLEVGPAGTMPARAAVYVASGEDPTGKLRETMVTRQEKRFLPILSEPDIMLEAPRGKRNDVLVAAQVKAAGGELWTFDPDYLTTKKGPQGLIRTGARPEVTREISEGGLGVKIAPESWEVPTARPPGGGGSLPQGSPTSGAPGGAAGASAVSSGTSKLKESGTRAPRALETTALGHGEASMVAERRAVQALPRSETGGETGAARAVARGGAEPGMERPSPKGMGLKGGPSPITGAVVSIGAGIAGGLLTSWMHDKMVQAVREMPRPSVNRASLWASGGVRDRTSLDLLASNLPNAVADFEAGRGRYTIEVLAFWNRWDAAPAAERQVLLDQLEDAVWQDQGRLLEAQRNVAEALQLEPQITEGVQAARELQTLVDNPVVFEQLATKTGMSAGEVAAVSSNLAWYQASFTRGVLQPLHRLATRLQETFDGNEALLDQIKLATRR